MDNQQTPPQASTVITDTPTVTVTIPINDHTETLTSDNLTNIKAMAACGKCYTWKHQNCELGKIPTIIATPQQTSEAQVSGVADAGELTKREEEAIAIAVVQTAPKTQQGEIVEDKRGVGRPSKYNEGMLQKANSYLMECLMGEMKDEKRTYKLPLIEELARLCEVDSETVMNWTQEDEQFFDTIKRIKELQKERIINKGFTAKNPTFSIFMLKANHGMMETEKQVLVQDRDVKVSITRE